MHVPLVFFFYQIVIIISLAQNKFDDMMSKNNTSDRVQDDLKEITYPITHSTDRKVDKKSDIETVEATELSSTNVFQNDMKILNNDNKFSQTQLLPIINIATKLIENAGNVIKDQIGIGQASSEGGGPPSYAFVNYTFTECRSLSLLGGRNCITKGFTIGGLTTIFALLVVSLGLKLVQTLKEINTTTSAPQGVIYFQHQLPINEQFSRHPFNIRPIGNIHPFHGPLITSSSSGKTSENNILPTMRPTPPQGFRESYNNNKLSLHSFYPINRLGKGDEMIYDNEYIRHRD